MTAAPVTLAVPMYRSAEFLPGLFQVIRGMSPPPAEIVFLDDASPDNSFDLAEAFSATVGGGISVRVLRNPNNLGIAGTYNRLAQEATQPWVHILDADDYPVEASFYASLNRVLTSKAELIVAALTSNSRVLAWGNAVLGWIVPARPPRWWPLLGSFATRSGVLYRRPLLQTTPFPDPAFPGSDVIHFLRLRAQHTCVYLRTVHVHYRVHAGATSSQARNYQAYRSALASMPMAVRATHLLDLHLRTLGQSIGRSSEVAE